jgi:hypothetical protein
VGRRLGASPGRHKSRSRRPLSETTEFRDVHFPRNDSRPQPSTRPQTPLSLQSPVNPHQYRQNGWCYSQGRRGTRHPEFAPAARSRPLTPPQAQKFIGAYAAFLKRQGKLPMYVQPPLDSIGIFANTWQSRFVSVQRVKKSLNPVIGG